MPEGSEPSWHCHTSPFPDPGLSSKHTVRLALSTYLLVELLTPPPLHAAPQRREQGPCRFLAPAPVRGMINVSRVMGIIMGWPLSLRA